MPKGTLKERVAKRTKQAKKVISQQREHLKENQKKIKETIIRHKIFFVGLLLLFIGSIHNYWRGGLLYTIFQNDPTTLLNFVSQFNEFGVLVYIILIALEVLIAPIPSVVLYAAGGMLFGSVKGAFIILIGNLIGASAAYFLARYFLQEYVERITNPKIMNLFNRYAQKYGAFGMFFLRLNPFTSSDVFSYLAGITRMKFLSFILGTTIGLIPLIFVQTYLGSDVIAKSSILSTTFLIFSVLYIGVIVVLIIKHARR